MLLNAWLLGLGNSKEVKFVRMVFSSMTGVDSERFLIDDWGIFFMGIHSVRSDKTFAFAMCSTVQLWRGKNSMFTQGFVRSTSSWVGTSSAQ